MTRRHISVVPALPATRPNEWLRTATAQRDGQSLLHVAADAEDLPAARERDRGHGAPPRRSSSSCSTSAPGQASKRRLAPLGALARCTTCSPGPPEVPEDVVRRARRVPARPRSSSTSTTRSGCAARSPPPSRGISIVRIGGVPTTGTGRAIARLADVLLTRSAADALDAPISRSRAERVTRRRQPAGRRRPAPRPRRARRGRLASLRGRPGQLRARRADRPRAASPWSSRPCIETRRPATRSCSRPRPGGSFRRAHRFSHLSFLDRLSLRAHGDGDRHRFGPRLRGGRRPRRPLPLVDADGRDRYRPSSATMRAGHRSWDGRAGRARRERADGQLRPPAPRELPLTRHRASRAKPVEPRDTGRPIPRVSSHRAVVAAARRRG